MSQIAMGEVSSSETHSQRDLSEREKACLRLVGEGLTSKEIAIRLNTTAGTVDNYVMTAVRLLRASSRRRAAAILLQREQAQEQPVQQLHVHSPTLVLHAKSDELGKPEAETDGSPDVSALAPQSVRPETPGRRWGRQILVGALDHIGGSQHTLTRWQIILSILLVSLLTSSGLAAIIAVYFWMHFILN